MKFYLRAGLKYLGFFNFLRLLIQIKHGRGGIAYVNYILRKLNYHDYLFDKLNDVKFKVKYNDLISMSILKSGSYEKESLHLAIRALQIKTGILLDIGANFGLYSIYAAKVAGAKVIAVDALPESFSLLIDNIEINCLRHQITPCNLVLSSSPHFAYFGHHDKGNLGSSRVKSEMSKEQPRQFIVDTSTLDSLLKFINTDFSTISLVKLDIEGHEYAVLKNSKIWEIARPAYFLIEVQPGNECFNNITDLMYANRYVPYTISGNRYEPGMEIPESNLFFIDNENINSLLRVFKT